MIVGYIILGGFYLATLYKRVPAIYKAYKTGNMGRMKAELLFLGLSTLVLAGVIWIIESMLRS